MPTSYSGNNNQKKMGLSWGPKTFKITAVILLVLLLDLDKERKCFKNDKQVNENGEYREEVTFAKKDLLDLIKKYKVPINKTIRFGDDEKDDNGDIKFFVQESNPNNKNNLFSHHIKRMITIDIFEIPIGDTNNPGNFRGKKKWNLILKLDNSKDIDKNINHLCHSWNSYEKHPPNSPEIKIDKVFRQSSEERPKIQSTNKSNEQDKIQEVANLLRTLDCDKQTEIIKQNKGIFFLKTYNTMQMWLIWRLGKHIRNYDIRQRIIIGGEQNKTLIKIKSFDCILKEIARHINVDENNVNRETVIQRLAELVKTKTVVITIFDCDKLKKDTFDEILKLSNDLREHTLDINRTLNIFIFLLVDIANETDYEQKCKQKQLVLKDICDNQVSGWFIENKESLQRNKYDLSCEQKIIKDYSDLDNRNPDSLIDDICSNVFKLKNGIFDVEHYWKNIA